ncbi:MAG: hypothetical protein KHX55_07270 [Proteobacteria bacterium]|nr:hypothetical protein [Pseudomonadota bacterium]
MSNNRNIKFYVKAEWDDQTTFDLKQIAYWIANRIYIDLEDETKGFLSDRDYLYNFNYPSYSFALDKVVDRENDYFNKVEKYLDEAKAKLYLHIKNKDFVLYGYKLKKFIGIDKFQWKDKKQFEYLDDVGETVRIDIDDIYMDGICLDDGNIHSSKGAYAAYIKGNDIEKLFSLYPPHKEEEFDIHIKKHSGVCFIDGQDLKKLNPYWGEYFYPKTNKSKYEDYFLVYHQRSEKISNETKDNTSAVRGRGPSYNWEVFLQKLLPEIIKDPKNYKFINKKDFERKMQDMYSALMDSSCPSEQAIRGRLDTLYKGLLDIKK